MTGLRDHFDFTQKKDIKNKAGQVVRQVDYIGWSQAADRLDDAAPGWSFSVMTLGEDWCHGRLTLADGRWFENVGYAENADAEWKKEALKDAVSDAFKRCAALAGVARYLYDKDAPTTSGTGATRAPAPAAGSRPAPSGDPAARGGNAPICECGEPYRGEPGDWWHKARDGKFHRHPDNVKKGAAPKPHPLPPSDEPPPLDDADLATLAF